MIDLLILGFEKIREFSAMALKFVSAEVLVLLIIGAGLALYLFVGSTQNAKRALQRQMNKAQEKFCMDYINGRIRIVFDYMNGDNKEAFFKGCEMYLKEKNYKLSTDSVRLMLLDNMDKRGKSKALREEYAFCDEGDNLVEAIYKGIQIGLKRGPEYKKLMKRVNAEIEKKMQDMKFDADMANPGEMSEKAFKDHAFDNLDMQMQMQNQMQTDMQMQMQQQMQTDMQMQMQNQMQMDMQMQMQQQMQMDMQMQMQQQMQMDMMNQMTQQMSMDSMNMANQAMTSTDFGGFMVHDAHSGNFGPF